MLGFKKNTWVVVANGSECKIFSGREKMQLNLEQNFCSTYARSHNRDLETERPGHFHESSSFAKHAMELKMDSQTKEKIKFAHYVSSILYKELIEKKFDNLMIISSPDFLGELRHHLNKHIKSVITKEIDKDLVHFTEKEILNFIVNEA